MPGKFRQKSSPEDIPGYKLEELAARTGLNPRTIRSYIAQKLMAGPGSRGRNARYSDSQLARLLAIVELRNERGLSLDKTRQLLATMTETEIRDLVGLGPPEAGPTAADTERSIARSALQYLDEVLGTASPKTLSSTAHDGSIAAGPTGPMGDIEAPGPSGSPDQSETRYQRILELLDTTEDADALELTGRSARVPSAARRLARAEPSYDIEITPDISIRVKGKTDPQALRRLERLADYFRHALTGGFDDQRFDDK